MALLYGRAAEAALEAGQPGQAARLLLQDVHLAWYLGLAELNDVYARLGAIQFRDDDPLGPLIGYQLATHAVALDKYEQPAPPARPAFARARELGAQAPRDLVQVCGSTFLAGDDEVTRELAAELVAEARAEGVSGQLPVLLFFLAQAELFLGRHHEAAADAAESLRIAQDTGQPQWTGQLRAFLSHLAALEGDADRCRELSDEALRGAGTGAAGTGGPEASGAGAGGAVAAGVWATWAAGLLDLGEGRAQEALTRLHSVVTGPHWYHVAGMRAIPDMVEAAVLAGAPAQAAEPLARFERWARWTGQPSIRALADRCRAMLAADDEAESGYIAAMRAYSVQDRPFERARTQLCYGEWLRRTRRRGDARPELAGAVEVFTRLGTAPWARRARAELDACGR